MSDPGAPESERGSRWSALLAVAAIIGITAFTFGADLVMPDEPPRPDPPRELPSLRSEETPVTVFGTTGLTVIRFWSATCGACEEEIAETSAIAAAFPEVRFIAAGVDEDPSAGAAWASALEPSVFAASDAERLLASALEVSAVPATVILDGRRSVKRRFHAVDDATLRAVLERLGDQPVGAARQRVGRTRPAGRI